MEMMNQTISNGSYIKGAKSVKKILKTSIKEGIIFSSELIVLSILLLFYSGVASALTIGMITIAILLLIATVITKSIFENKLSLFHSTHSEEVDLKSKNKEFIDDSMDVLKMGSYTAIINIITTTISLITVFILVISMLG